MPQGDHSAKAFRQLLQGIGALKMQLVRERLGRQCCLALATGKRSLTDADAGDYVVRNGVSHRMWVCIPTSSARLAA